MTLDLILSIISNDGGSIYWFPNVKFEIKIEQELYFTNPAIQIEPLLFSVFIITLGSGGV